MNKPTTLWTQILSSNSFLLKHSYEPPHSTLKTEVKVEEKKIGNCYSTSKQIKLNLKRQGESELYTTKKRSSLNRTDSGRTIQGRTSLKQQETAPFHQGRPDL